MFQALGRFEQNHRIELAAHEDYDRWRASARDAKGRVLKGNSKPFPAPRSYQTDQYPGYSDSLATSRSPGLGAVAGSRLPPSLMGFGSGKAKSADSRDLASAQSRSAA